MTTAATDRVGTSYWTRIVESWDRISAATSLVAILLYLLQSYSLHRSTRVAAIPLWVAIAAGGIPLVFDLSRQMWRREFGSDFLAGISIVTAALMGEFLVATIIVLMLSGGQALEKFATRRASSILSALAERTPSVAHRIQGSTTSIIPVSDIQIGDRLIVFPHEICPVDGVVESGTGAMDESFLTGEPFRIRKISGSQVISGALNEDASLTIIAEKLAVDSRYDRIMQVLRNAEKNPPKIRRLADRLGAFYTPVAVAIALTAWLSSGVAERFLAVIVIATPCPLLLAIPISIIGAISLSAKRGIVIKNPVILEQVGDIQAMFFDKTGTLTHGEPSVTEVISSAQSTSAEVLGLSASLEQFSKHPLAGAIIRAAREGSIPLEAVENISERPGGGLSGRVAGKDVLITGRRKLDPELAATVPAGASGMESVVIVDGQFSGLIRFHDRPRSDSKPFLLHLRPKHQVKTLTILSGDRDTEVQHLAQLVGIKDARADLTPEEKLQIVRDSTAQVPTLFIGDGMNDAPAMLAATVGIAFGQSSDITAEAAGAVILEPSLAKVDELLHIGKRMRRIALQSAVGGIALSSAGMIAAAVGLLPPVAGAVGQEVIDLLAVLNAVRASFPGKTLQDF